MADILPHLHSEAPSVEPPDEATGADLHGSGGSVYGGLYIKRPADDRLFELCQAGEYANVLASRQIGKSSLMDATIERLEAVGTRTVRVDLNGIGTPAEANRWYLGLVTLVADTLELDTDPFGWWGERTHLSEAQRLTEFFQEVLLAEVAQPVVIFVDEIDTTLALPYADDFFAAIRALYVARSSQPQLKRLSFVLLGVATPGELVKDPNRTPYNIGESVEMTDFTPQEAAPLAATLTGLPAARRPAVLERVLYWTGGHPYLTGRALGRLDETGQASPGEVDAAIRGLFMGTLSNADNQVEFVRKMLRNDPPRLPPAQTALVLETYREIWRGRKVEDERQSPVKNHLKLSGAVRVKNGLFVVRNRIYRQVFNKSWIKKQQEPVPLVAALRRLAPLLAVGVLIFLLVAALAVIAFLQFQNANSNAATAQANSNRAFTAESNANYNAVTAVAERNRAFTAESNANNNAATAVAERDKTEAQRKIALSRQLTTQIRPLLPVFTGNDVSGGNSTTAFLLSIQARRLNNQLEANNPFNEAASDINTFPTLTGHSDAVLSVAFSPDGKTLASASDDKTIRLWDVASHSPLATLAGYSSIVYRLAFSPDGRTLASASGDKTIRLWDVASHSPLATLAGYSSIVYSVAFSPDGKTLASASSDGTIRLWDVASHSELATLAGHSNSVYSVAFSPDGKTLASAADDRIIQLWDVASHAPLATLAGHSSAVLSVAFSPDGKTLASASSDGTIRLWDVASHSSLATLKGHSSFVAFSPDGKTLASTSDDKTIRLWDVASHAPLAILTGHSSTVKSVAFSPDGKTLASTSDDKTIRLWDVASHSSLATLAGHSSSVESVAFSPDGKTLASAADDRIIRLWDVASHSELATLVGHSDAVYSVAFSPDGKILASASTDKTIRLWDVASHAPLVTLTGHSSFVRSVAFSPDGKTLASASDDKTIRLWDVASHAPLATLAGHSSFVYRLAFSPDGRTLASASGDTTIRLWDVASHAPLATLAGHFSSVWSVAFSPDGRTLASASGDKTIRLWDVASRSPLATLDGHSNSVYSVAFSPDGKTLASASSDKTIILWDNWYTNDWLDRACKLAGRNLTWAEWQQYAGVGEPYLQTCPSWPLPDDLPADQKASLTPAPTPSSPTITPAPTPTAKP